jgi:hypothetical protein
VQSRECGSVQVGTRTDRPGGVLGESHEVEHGWTPGGGRRDQCSSSASPVDRPIAQPVVSQARSLRHLTRSRGGREIRAKSPTGVQRIPAFSPLFEPAVPR